MAPKTPDASLKKKKKKMITKKKVQPKVKPEDVDSGDDMTVETTEVGESVDNQETTSDIKEEVEGNIKEELELDDELPEDVEDEEKVVKNPEEVQRKSGVIYFSFIPPGFGQAGFRKEMDSISKGCVKRMFLVPTVPLDKKKSSQFNAVEVKKKKLKSLSYKEGWVEFTKKSVAKKIAIALNGSPIAVKTKHRASGMLWTCKYLPGFKWVHLVEQLQYEKKVKNERMQVEIAQAKRVADHFSHQVDKGENLKRLEEKVLKKGGLWEKHQRQIDQRRTQAQKLKMGMNAPGPKPADNDLMNMIFAE